MFELTVIFFREQYKTRHHDIKDKLKDGISIIPSSLFPKAMPYCIFKIVLFNWGNWGT